MLVFPPALVASCFKELTIAAPICETFLKSQFINPKKTPNFINSPKTSPISALRIMSIPRVQARLIAPRE